ncbi:hypothetical protein [Streptomyces sp. NPDC002676]
MPEDLLNREQIKAPEVELGCAKVPQDVWRELVDPAGQMGLRCGRQAVEQRVVADPARGTVGVLALGGAQRGTGTGVVVVELAPDVLVNHRSVRSAPLIGGTIRSRGPDPRAPLP